MSTLAEMEQRILDLLREELEGTLTVTADVSLPCDVFGHYDLDETTIAIVSFVPTQESGRVGTIEPFLLPVTRRPYDREIREFNILADDMKRRWSVPYVMRVPAGVRGVNHAGFGLRWP